ncbi:hypothetical protein, partial [Vibrio parahaemolyticus]|uniref:hypothetical protein n=1 Tax=Vibrio parahaemolyticus TaxID=670 RepID=UPI001C5FEB8E
QFSRGKLWLNTESQKPLTVGSKSSSSQLFLSKVEYDFSLLRVDFFDSNVYLSAKCKSCRLA